MERRNFIKNIMAVSAVVATVPTMVLLKKRAQKKKQLQK